MTHPPAGEKNKAPLASAAFQIEIDQQDCGRRSVEAQRTVVAQKVLGRETIQNYAAHPSALIGAPSSLRSERSGAGRPARIARNEPARGRIGDITRHRQVGPCCRCENLQIERLVLAMQTSTTSIATGIDLLAGWRSPAPNPNLRVRSRYATRAANTILVQALPKPRGHGKRR